MTARAPIDAERVDPVVAFHRSIDRAYRRVWFLAWTSGVLVAAAAFELFVIVKLVEDRNQLIDLIVAAGVTP